MHPCPHRGKKKALVDASLQICCEAVKLALQSAADIARLDADPCMFKALWYVHQVSFCCMSTIHLLPRIREYQKKYSFQALGTLFDRSCFRLGTVVSQRLSLEMQILLLSLKPTLAPSRPWTRKSRLGIGKPTMLLMWHGTRFIHCQRPDWGKNSIYGAYPLLVD